MTQLSSFILYGYLVEAFVTLDQRLPYGEPFEGVGSQIHLPLGRTAMRLSLPSPTRPAFGRTERAGGEVSSGYPC